MAILGRHSSFNRPTVHINSLKSISSNQFSMSQENEFPICLLSMADKVTLSCKHEFCHSCIQTVLSNWNPDSRKPDDYPTCPYCRQKLQEWSQSTTRLSWVVSSIVDHRGRGRCTYYRVKWETGELTWEPTRNLEDAQCVLAAYRKRVHARKQADFRQRRASGISLRARRSSRS